MNKYHHKNQAPFAISHSILLKAQVYEENILGIKLLYSLNFFFPTPEGTCLNL